MATGVNKKEGRGSINDSSGDDDDETKKKYEAEEACGMIVEAKKLSVDRVVVWA